MNFDFTDFQIFALSPFVTFMYLCRTYHRGWHGFDSM